MASLGQTTPSEETKKSAQTLTTSPFLLKVNEMLTKKKMLSILAMLLFAVLGTMTTVQAMEVYIYTDAEGNITVTTADEGNGTLTIIYNGVDLLAVLDGQRQEVNSLWAEIQYWQSMNYYDVSSLYGKLNGLIEELNGVFNDVYGNLGLLVRLIGLDSNSTITVDLDNTVVDHLNNAFDNLNQIDSEISSLQGELTDNYGEIYGGLENQEERSDALEEYVNELEELINQRLSMLNSSILEETDRQTMMQRNLDVFMALSVFLTIVLAVLATALVYVSKKKTTQQLKPKL